MLCVVGLCLVLSGSGCVSVCLHFLLLDCICCCWFVCASLRCVRCCCWCVLGVVGHCLSLCVCVRCCLVVVVVVGLCLVMVRCLCLFLWICDWCCLVRGCCCFVLGFDLVVVVCLLSVSGCCWCVFGVVCSCHWFAYLRLLLCGVVLVIVGLRVRFVVVFVFVVVC